MISIWFKSYKKRSYPGKHIGILRSMGNWSHEHSSINELPEELRSIVLHYFISNQAKIETILELTLTPMNLKEKAIYVRYNKKITMLLWTLLAKPLNNFYKICSQFPSFKYMTEKYCFLMMTNYPYIQWLYWIYLW